MIVLLYHRIAELPADPQLLCVCPRHFEEHLHILQKTCAVVPLSAGLDRPAERQASNRDVAITFDDGYADSLEVAGPALERFGAPATVFVTARDDAAVREFWWDALERVLLHPGRLPAELRVDCASIHASWLLGTWADYTGPQFETHRRWTVLDDRTPTARHRAYRDLCRLIRPLPSGERVEILRALFETAGMPEAPRRSHRTLTDDQIADLSAVGLIEIGAHTCTHPVLAALSPDEQRREIAQSRTCLERINGRPVRSFAYPFGGCADYSMTTVELVREAGFACACANVPGLVTAESDRFQWPRHVVRNWDGDEFARRLERWLHG